MTNTKKTIKKVCINLFYKMGYFACGISDIARAARIQKSSIYYHYSNKEEILFDILKTTMADLIENLDSRLKDVKNTEERLRVAIRTHILFHIERQKEVLISDSELRGLTINNDKTIIKMRDEYEQKFRSIIKTGKDEGIFINDDFKIISNAIITMCTAVSTWFSSSGALSGEEIARIYTDLILCGLKR